MWTCRWNETTGSWTHASWLHCSWDVRTYHNINTALVCGLIERWLAIVDDIIPRRFWTQSVGSSVRRKLLSKYPKSDNLNIFDMFGTWVGPLYFEGVRSHDLGWCRPTNDVSGSGRNYNSAQFGKKQCQRISRSIESIFALRSTKTKIVDMKNVGVLILILKRTKPIEPRPGRKPAPSSSVRRSEAPDIPVSIRNWFLWIIRKELPAFS